MDLSYGEATGGSSATAGLGVLIPWNRLEATPGIRSPAALGAFRSRRWGGDADEQGAVDAPPEQHRRGR